MNRKRAKGRPHIISMVIWATSLGHYSFIVSMVHSPQIPGEGKQTKGEMSICAVKSGGRGGAGKMLACQSSMGKGSLARRMKPLQACEILEG